MVKLRTETNTSPSRNAYVKTAFCSVLQQVLGANLTTETNFAANSAQNQIQNPPATITTKPP